METDSSKKLIRLGGLGCGDDGDGDDEDERVNKFFALIRSFREVRDRSASDIGVPKSEEDRDGDADRKNNKNKQQQEKEKKKKKKKIDAQLKDSPTRTPSFRCEDFAQVPEYRSESAAAPDSAIGNKKRKEKAAEEQQVPEGHLRLIQHGRGLDLNLSLCCSGHDFAEP